MIQTTKLVYSNGESGVSFLVNPTDKLEYVINFQNTGTTTAVNVLIEDSLSNKLDWDSFEFISSSHSTIATLDNSGLLTFFFENINLVDSSTSEPMSKGFVKFRIGISNIVEPNDTLLNNALIYFDMNAPILTASAFNQLTCFITPPSPDLYTNNGFLQTDLSTGTYSMNWYYNGLLISGANSNSIELGEPGSYLIEVTNSYGCVTTGSYIFSDVSAEVPQARFQVYPNPSSSNFTFTASLSGEIRIYNAHGELIDLCVLNGNSDFVWKQENLDSGIYYAELLTEHGEVSLIRLIKL